jgi:hypothetical protein
MPLICTCRHSRPYSASTAQDHTSTSTSSNHTATQTAVQLQLARHLSMHSATNSSSRWRCQIMMLQVRPTALRCTAVSGSPNLPSTIKDALSVC